MIFWDETEIEKRKEARTESRGPPSFRGPVEEGGPARHWKGMACEVG